MLAAALLASVPLAHAATLPLATRLAQMSEVTRFTPERALSQLLAMAPETRAATPALQGEWLGQLCLAYFKLGKYDEAVGNCDALIALGTRQGDRRLLAEGLLDKAYVEFALNRPGHAHQLVWNAEQLAAGLPDVSVRIRTMISSGQSYAEEGNFTAALARLVAAVALARDQGTPTHRVMTQNALAVLYGQLHQPDKAFATLKEAAAVAQQPGVAPARAATVQNTEANLASELGQYRRALGALQAALALERQAGAEPLVAAALLKLSDCYLKLADYDNASAYAQQALARARALGNDKLANAARVNLSQATPNGYERRRRADLLEMQDRYEANQRSRAIELLRRENALSAAEIANRRLQQRMWAMALGILALAALLVGLLYRKVRQANAALHRNNLELKRQSERDPLTGAYNRRYFQEAMRHGAPLQEGADEKAGGLFLLDVDHFKRINDQHGHAAGDAVLLALAARLQALVGDGMVVRWGGEEFLLHVPGLAPAALDGMARRLLAGIADHAVDLPNVRLPVTISMGYAPLPLRTGGRTLPWEGVLNLVDMALYLAKARGRDRACGVRTLADGGKATLERIEAGLDAAWRDGLVDLVVVTAGARTPGAEGHAAATAADLQDTAA